MRMKMKRWIRFKVLANNLTLSWIRYGDGGRWWWGRSWGGGWRSKTQEPKSGQSGKFCPRNFIFLPLHYFYTFLLSDLYSIDLHLLLVEIPKFIYCQLIAVSDMCMRWYFTNVLLYIFYKSINYLSYFLHRLLLFSLHPLILLVNKATWMTVIWNAEKVLRYQV